MIVGVAVALSLGAVSAFAEIAQKGNLFVRFDGAISPTKLPRNGLAPIAARIEGTIKSPGGGRPPALRRVSLALNRGGRLSSAGLPVCRPEQLGSAFPPQALAVCGDALVGGGGYEARSALPGQTSTFTHGEILLFNTVIDGRPAILAHLFQTHPTSSPRLMVFQIRRAPGTFSTLITGKLPAGLHRNGYVKSIFLELSRRYVVRGHARSFLSAGCSTPPGVPQAAFPFARVSMKFADGRTLASTLTRTCQVRR
jgi:hypothetical protein